MEVAQPVAQTGGAELPSPVTGDAPVSLSRRPSPPRAPIASESAARLGPGRAYCRVRGAGSRGNTCPALQSRLGQPRPLPVWTPGPPTGKSVGLVHLGVDVGRGCRGLGESPEEGMGAPTGRRHVGNCACREGLGGGGPGDERSVCDDSGAGAKV